MQIFIKFKNFEKDEDIDDDDIISESRVPSFVVNLKEENNIKIDEKDKLNKDEKQLPNKAEQVFREKFMNTSKYKSFFINFCQHHEVIDLYKIPYTFINELIYYSKYYISINLMEIDMVGIMEQFYGKIKLLDFDEINIIKQKNLGIKKLPKKRKERKDKKKYNR